MSAKLCLSALLLMMSCGTSKKAVQDNSLPRPRTTPASPAGKTKTFAKPLIIDRGEFVSFAKTLLGTPYKYGSAVPAQGLDCSGFVTYVFGHFNVKSPRTTAAFTNEGNDVDPQDAKPGDLILFTGSDNKSGVVGHMGIITANNKNLLRFIHSASGKNIGVILNDLTGYYETHFVKVISILE